MLDLDAIERAANDDDTPMEWRHTTHSLLAELRKCRAAMRSVQERIGIDGTLSPVAIDAVNDAMRGAE